MPYVQCDWCGKECYKRPRKAAKNKYNFCSLQCYRAWQTEQTKPNVICEWCGKKFFKSPCLIERDGHHHCSKECQLNHAHSERPSFTCEVCGRVFNVPPSTPQHNACRFCSPQCAGTDVESIQKICKYCGKAYTVIPSRADISRFCSRKCKNAVQTKEFSGPNNPSWKGGPIDDYGHNWESQRRLALERDKVCLLCGAPRSQCGYELDVHHIIPMREFDGNWEAANCLSNLVALCRNCHLLVENNKVQCPHPGL